MFLAMRVVLSSWAMHHTVNLYLTIAFSSEEKHAARIYPFGILTFRCFVTWYKMQACTSGGHQRDGLFLNWPTAV